MLTIVNSVDSQGAVLAVLTARKKPYVVSLVAKAGVTIVAQFVLNRFAHRAEAEGEMYHAFDVVNSYSPEVPDDVCESDKIFRLVRFVESVFGDCAFSVVVEKMEI